MLDIIFKNWRTSVVGAVVIVFTTTVFLLERVSWEQATMGWTFGFGLLVSKDGQTKTEYRDECANIVSFGDEVLEQETKHLNN